MKDDGDFTALERTVVDAAFSGGEPLLPPPTVPLAVLLVFGTAAAGLLFIGRSAESARLRFYRLAALAALSGAVSAWAALEPRTIPSRRLEMLYAWNAGDSRTLDITRYASSVQEVIDVPLDGKGVPYPVPGRDLCLAGTAGERILEGLVLEPWTATDVVVRGSVEGRRSEDALQPEQGGYRHNGAEPWFDIVGIDEAGAASLADRLDPGEVLTVEGKPTLLEDGAFGEGTYSRIVDGVTKAYRTGVLDGSRLLLARTEPDRNGAFRLIVMEGDGQ